MQIGLVDWDLAKNYSGRDRVEGRCEGDAAGANPRAQSRRRRGARYARSRSGIAALASKNWTAKRAMLVDQISLKRDSSPIDPDWLALQVVEAMPANAILVDEGLTSSRYISALRPHRDRYGYHGLASGGIGWGLPASVGVSLANPDRPVVCFSGDGSAMYSIQALWTAAHHKLPLTVVIVNNGGYRIIKQRLLAFHKDDHFVGMDFVDPPVDFCGLAKALGLEAIRITKAGGSSFDAQVGVRPARSETDRGDGGWFGEMRWNCRITISSREQRSMRRPASIALRTPWTANPARVQKRNPRRNEANHHDPEQCGAVPQAAPIVGRIDRDLLGPRRKIRLHQPKRRGLIAVLVARRCHALEMPQNRGSSRIQLSILRGLRRCSCYGAIAAEHLFPRRPISRWTAAGIQVLYKT